MNSFDDRVNNLQATERCLGIHRVFQAVTLTMAGLVFAFKASLASGLGYTSDLFNFVVMSKSFWLGRPWYYENLRGFDSYLHNNFIIPLLGAVTFPFGMYGIFFLLALTLAGASLSVEYIAHSISDSRSKWIRGLNIVILLGPVTFWILDNPTYGFHPELFYISFATLHAVARINGSRFVILTAIAICMVRQEGAIVVCTLELLYLVFRGPLTLVALRACWAQALRTIFFWAIVFLLGLWLLNQFGAPGQARIKQALDHFPEILSATPTRSVTFMMLWHCLLFITSGLLLSCCCFPYRTVLSLPFLLPSLGICLTASFAYLPDALTTLAHGMSWNPRMAILWSIIVPIGLFVVRFGTPMIDVRSRTWVVIVISMTCVAFQSFVLWHVRSYNVVARVTDVAIGKSPIATMAKVEIDFINCLAIELPTSTAIAVHGSLMGVFHRFDIVFPNGIQNAWVSPEVIVCSSSSQLPFECQCSASLHSIVASQSFQFRTVEGISVAFTDRLRSDVLRCINR